MKMHSKFAFVASAAVCFGHSSLLFVFLWGKGAWEAMNNVSPSKIGKRGKNVASILIGYVDATGYETGQENGISLKWELLGKTRVLVV